MRDPKSTFVPRIFLVGRKRPTSCVYCPRGCSAQAGNKFIPEICHGFLFRHCCYGRPLSGPERPGEKISRFQKHLEHRHIICRDKVKHPKITENFFFCCDVSKCEIPKSLAFWKIMVNHQLRMNNKQWIVGEKRSKYGNIIPRRLSPRKVPSGDGKMKCQRPQTERKD